MSFEHPSTDVYECSVNDAPIMRRCKDDWVNATQILKLCDFPKAKRTKILEKGVQQGLHEKVQGGYGRFQGTWIPLQDARKLATEYNISAEMVPVLYVDIEDPAVIISRKPKGSAPNKDGTPSKRKYVRKTASKDAATPKKMKFDDHLPPQAVFTQDYPHAMSRTPSTVPPMTNGNMHMSQMPMSAQPVAMGLLQAAPSQPEFMPGYSQFSMPDTNFSQQAQSQPVHGQLPYGKGPYPAGMEGIAQQQPPPRQQQPQPQSQHPQHPQQHQQQQHQQQQQIAYQHRQKGSSSHSTNETNWSQEEHTRDSDTSISSTDPKAANVSLDEDNSHVTQLLRFFSEDNAPIPYFLYNPPPDFNINEPIDDEGHSTLHWAASIGNLTLVHLLLSKGANPLAVSNFGLNPLSKCIAFNNCFDLKNFPHIVDALEMCLINTDINGRTPLHYLCQFSKVASKLPALSYYIDIIFERLRVMSRNSGTGVDLIKNVIDHQDVNGDTCLHLAARVGCTQLVKFFLNNGARDDLLDLNNQTAKALIMQLDLVVYNFDQPNGMDQHARARALNQSRAPQKHAYEAPIAGQTPTQQHQQRPPLQQHQQPTAPQPPPPPPPPPPQSQAQTPAPIPTFQVSSAGNEGSNEAEAKPIAPGLGTPIRSYSRLAETPDTQRTTIQEEEVEELHDRVSKEDLKSLLDRQAGTVEDNKENIFVDDQMKRTAYDSMSTPKQSFAPHAPRSNVLGAISERVIESTPELSPARSYSPHPPQLDRSGQLIEKQGNGNGRSSAQVEREDQEVSLPMKDVSSMVNGMMNSLSTSYEEQLSGLRSEQERIKTELAEKRVQDRTCSHNVKTLLDRNGFTGINTLEDAADAAASEANKYSQDLKHKEAQLSCTLGKWHAYELASLVEQQESTIDPATQENNGNNGNDAQTRWSLSLQLTQAQLKRVELANILGERIRDFAINTKMNKYRKLISLSCGLRVEDIDGLIDGIEASLNEGAMEAN
ncbi:hypothetical protein JCM33374_g2748 [Metschnikowia sp. JCM 33374]|nr:hypothetical protein JCM33374_g2748 [Metschnikowia sp. JCM 33374]